MHGDTIETLVKQEVWAAEYRFVGSLNADVRTHALRMPRRLHPTAAADAMGCAL